MNVSVVSTRDARLRVFADGDGKQIVLLPGQGRGPGDFDPLCRALVSQGFQVIRPEPRGFGESSGKVDGLTLRDHAADIAAVILSFGRGPVVVAGWAYGNRVARMLAAEWPELVRGVVLIAAGGRFPPAQGVLATLARVQDRTLPLDERARAARAVHYGPRSTLSIDAMRLDEISEATLKAQTLAPTVPLDTWWAAGDRPILALQGLCDVIAPPENGRALAAEHPDRVTLIEFEHLGHYMARERPDLIADAICRWEPTLPR